MHPWRPVKALAVGGIVAVGFVDERRVLVGSHSGLGVFEASSGTRLERIPDPDGAYAWLVETPPTALYVSDGRERRVPVAGIWGGSFRDTTEDGWSSVQVSTGVRLRGPAGLSVAVDADGEEPCAFGFSGEGQVFIFATASTLYVAVRSTV